MTFTDKSGGGKTSNILTNVIWADAMSEPVNATAPKPFVGAKNFQVSKDFYLDMGFAINWESSNLIQFEFTGCQFYLQDFYEPTLCDNTISTKRPLK